MWTDVAAGRELLLHSEQYTLFLKAGTVPLGSMQGKGMQAIAACMLLLGFTNIGIAAHKVCKDFSRYKGWHDAGVT